MSIKKVIVIGAAGNLGPSVVDALVSASFEVTVLTRITSTHTFSSAVKVYRIDYESESSLYEAFKTQDAVVSVIGSFAISQQKKIITAAAQAGVKRYIPSEFGVDTRYAEGGMAKILEEKIEIRKILEETCIKHEGFSWTAISTGLFFDWGLKRGVLGFSLDTKTATIYDSGNEKFHACTLSFVGKAVAAALHHHHHSKNRYLRVASFTISQNEVLEILQKETGTQFTITKESTTEILKVGEVKLAKGDRSCFHDFLRHHLFRDGRHHWHHEREVDNELLGLKVESVEETVRLVLKT